MSKLLEALFAFPHSQGVLNEELLDFVSSNGILPPEQCGFLRGLFLDVKKAFNSVWHNDWLRARSYKSRVREHKSKAAFHECGVPQGTVLSPLLFILFFSDVVDEISSDSFLFADDLSMLSRAFKVGNRMAFSSLQRDVWAIER
mmetsp:Transcript_11303/g.22700  ORF Transcript_11303/g.22700 Transcript_11303/m.22700 type:complete len:144 (-) Transcript_11303:1774-2205(-)